MSSYEEMINKSMEEIDAIIDNVKKSQEEEVDLQKSHPEDDVSPEDISDSHVPGDNEEDETDNEDNEGVAPDTDNEPDDVDEDYQKSLASELGSNESTSKALEISEFLQELVKSMDTVIDDRVQSIHKSLADSSDLSNSLLAKSVRGLALGQKAVLETNAEILKSFKALNKRVKELESQPVVRKSVSTPAQIIEKSFDSSLGNKPESKGNSLTKSQASAKLTAAYESGNAGVLNDILALEGTGNFESLSDEGKQVLGLL